MLSDRLDAISKIHSMMKGSEVAPVAKKVETPAPAKLVENSQLKTMVKEAGDKIRFSFKETKPDLDSFWGRFAYFVTLSDPKYFFKSDEEVLEGIKTWRKYEKMAE